MSSRPIAVVYALDLEGSALLEAMPEARHGASRGRPFADGEIAGRRVVAIRGGVGKVAAALATADAIERFQPEAVVVIGAAGALSPRVRVGDVILATETIQHDLGVRDGRRARPSPELRASLAAAARALGLDGRVHEGTILTGDRACVTLRRRLRLRWVYRRDRPLAVEMEGAAAGAAADAAGVPHAVIRVATDGAGPLALAEFRRHATRVGSIPARIVLAWLREPTSAGRTIS